VVRALISTDKILIDGLGSTTVSF
jgi:hypothetical protein